MQRIPLQTVIGLQGCRGIGVHVRGIGVHVQGDVQMLLLIVLAFRWFAGGV